MQAANQFLQTQTCKCKSSPTYSPCRLPRSTCSAPGFSGVPRTTHMLLGLAPKAKITLKGLVGPSQTLRQMTRSLRRLCRFAAPRCAVLMFSNATARRAARDRQREHTSETWPWNKQIHGARQFWKPWCQFGVRTCKNPALSRERYGFCLSLSKSCVGFFSCK